MAQPSGCFNGQLLGHLTAAQEFHTVIGLFYDACILQCLGIYHGAVLKAGEDLYIHAGVLGRKDVLESALGDSSLQGHLAALKAGAYTAAGAGVLALVALAGGFAVAGASAAAYTVALMGAAGSRRKLIQFHVRCTSSLIQLPQ